MKNQYPVITLLGSNSGNNVGDAAILSAIVDTLLKRLPEARFLVPATNPSFVNSNYGTRYRIRALNIMPWNLALRFLGLPTLKCLWQSDVALICDGIIFGKRLYNPAFNMLITLAPLALLARLCRCRLVCYSVGIGPFPKGRGSRLARFVMQSCDLLMMREAESRKLAQELGVTKPIELTGDAAYLNPVSSQERALEIARQKRIDTSRPLFGINVTRYVDSWMNEGGETSDASGLVSTLADGIASASLECGFNPVVFSTHPMDVVIAGRLAARLKAPLVSNTDYLSHDMQAVMRLCSLFLGMRFHSLVLSSAVSVPVVALVYAPKVRGLMQDLKCPEYALDLGTLSSAGLSQKLIQAWKEREELQRRQQVVVQEFKAGAERAAQRLTEEFFS